MTNGIVKKESFPESGKGNGKKVTGIRQYPERKNPPETPKTKEIGKRQTGGLPPLEEESKPEE